MAAVNFSVPDGWTNVRNLYGGIAFASEIDWQE